MWGHVGEMTFSKGFFCFQWRVMTYDLVASFPSVLFLLFQLSKHQIPPWSLNEDLFYFYFTFFFLMKKKRKIIIYCSLSAKLFCFCFLFASFFTIQVEFFYLLQFAVHQNIFLFLFL